MVILRMELTSMSNPLANNLTFLLPISLFLVKNILGHTVYKWNVFYKVIV